MKSRIIDKRNSDRAGGLYNAEYEHDACGVGMIVNINGDKSHELVDSALTVLENMKHRGAEGADNKTGDGAGILLQIPHEFILLQGIPVPEKGKYGTGLAFAPSVFLRALFFQKSLNPFARFLRRLSASECREAEIALAVAAEPAPRRAHYLRFV